MSLRTALLNANSAGTKELLERKVVLKPVQSCAVTTTGPFKHVMVASQVIIRADLDMRWSTRADGTNRFGLQASQN